jgi:N-acetylmuramoyl-L-alanine amidase
VTLAETMEIAPAAPLMSAPVATSPPPALVVQPVWPTNWFNTWISLESWGKYNHLGKPIRLSPGPYSAYQFGTTNGAMSIKVGSRVAYCNGLECWLGYAPQLVNGLPYIHALDAQKNFQPLISLPSYRFKIDRTIVLDPGHGGKDSGAKSIFNNAFEKDYTLDWALRLSRLLVTNGWKVLLTRSSDTDVALADRVAMAERYNADLFLSLHFNSGLPNRQLTGLETYCLTPAGMPSNLVRTYEDDPKQTYPNNAFDEQNFQLAVRLHRMLLQSTGATDRGVRRARFMGVLRGQNRPAVLLEAGYLSNPKEARQIATPEYRQKLAEAVVKVLE